MQRLFFTLQMLWRYRKYLYQYLAQSNLQTRTLLQISPEHLKNQGNKILILDFDGVLAGYGMASLEAPYQAWLKEAERVFGPKALFILSNRPCVSRQQYFTAHFPGIPFIKASRKKPYPEGILAILGKTLAKPEQVMIIDDRLLTGILAAILTGIKGLWLTAPKVNFHHKPLAECGFILLRCLDRLSIRVLHFLA